MRFHDRLERLFVDGGVGGSHPHKTVEARGRSDGDVKRAGFGFGHELQENGIARWGTKFVGQPASRIRGVVGKRFVDDGKRDPAGGELMSFRQGGKTSVARGQEESNKKRKNQFACKPA